MPKKREINQYHYRGGIERGPRYEWRDGYSENGPNGEIFYPWMTRGECRSAAKQAGCKAEFYREGKLETASR